MSRVVRKYNSVKKICDIDPKIDSNARVAFGGCILTPQIEAQIDRERLGIPEDVIQTFLGHILKPQETVLDDFHLEEKITEPTEKELEKELENEVISIKNRINPLTNGENVVQFEYETE